jgi:hypothetical protein
MVDPAEVSCLPLLASVLLLVPPEAGEERAVVEMGAAAEVLYPPSGRAPLRHPAYGAAVSASLYGEGNFKAMVGFGFEHVVHGWLGDPEKGEVAETGVYEGTEPAYRGQLFRMTPMARFGLENDVAFGYFGASPGYAIRTATLHCARGPCRAERTVEHGLTLGASLGAMFHPSRKVGLVLGGEVGLDWSWFPNGHPGLAPWNQAMSARFIVGWSF